MHEESKTRFILLLALVFSLSAFIISLAAFYKTSNVERVRQEHLQSVIEELKEETSAQTDPQGTPKVLEEFLNELKAHDYKV